MSTNMFKKYTESLTREWPVAEGTVAGDLVRNANSGQVGVALTSRGDAVSTQSLPGGLTLSGVKTGGAGNRPDSATVATDGSWLLAVEGVTNGGTHTGGGGTANGTLVYTDEDGDLSLTATDNDIAGVIDDGTIVGGIAPVKIGVVL